MSEKNQGLRSEPWFRPWSDLLPIARGLGLSRKWNEKSFVWRNLIVCAAGTLVIFLFIAAWLESQIRQSMIREVGRASSWLVEGKAHTLLQELEVRPTLSEDTQKQFAAFIGTPILGRKLLDIKIWRFDRTILFSSDTGAIGTKPRSTPELEGALAGRITSQFDDRYDAESSSQRSLGPSILEIYFPVRATGSDRVIAVAELYLDATTFIAELASTRRQSWLIIGSLVLALLLLIFGIIQHGNYVIHRQKREIDRELQNQAKLLKRNSDLNRRVREAQHKNVELSDQLLRHIGADLHDGPAQLLSVALLRLGEISTTDTSEKASGPQDRNPELIAAARRMTQDALTELRGIAKGLVLPQLGNLHAADVVRMAVADHKQRTRTDVKAEISLPGNDLPLVIKTCLFRCIQEGLNNAFRHAGAREQFVGVSTDKGAVVLKIKDSGPGLSRTGRSRRSDALGIAGLRNRVEALGGQFEIMSSIGVGTAIIVTLPLVDRT